MDNHTPETRSYNMSCIRSVGNKPEEIVCKYLFHKKFRYRKNVRRLPGCPDIVLSKYKTVIFINGCFWHQYEGCSDFVWPKSNISYWKEKLDKNKQRDSRNQEILRKEGWQVLVIWECELKKSRRELTLNQLWHRLKQQ